MQFTRIKKIIIYLTIIISIFVVFNTPVNAQPITDTEPITKTETIINTDNSITNKPTRNAESNTKTKKKQTKNNITLFDEDSLVYLVRNVIFGSLDIFSFLFFIIIIAKAVSTNRVIKLIENNQEAEQNININKVIRLLNKNNSSTISSLIEGITIILIVIGVIILGISELIQSEGIISILSAIVGYVLGSSKASKEEDRNEILSEREPTPGGEQTSEGRQ